MKLLTQSLLIFLCFTIITGLVYPFLMTGIAQLAFPRQANGSVIRVNGKTVGSEWIGQNFTKDIYFHGRASSLDYQADNSGGYNYGPGSSNLVAMVSDRIRDIRSREGLKPDDVIPPDMALASGSGLDPDISVENALIQSKRVASSRKMELKVVQDTLLKNADHPLFGVIGVVKVNVLKLNLALDKISAEGGK
jgi:potassium-transporting ATPase KdpC subunit